MDVEDFLQFLGVTGASTRPSLDDEIHRVGGCGSLGFMGFWPQQRGVLCVYFSDVLVIWENTEKHTACFSDWKKLQLSDEFEVL